jgi:hypothetical protein
MAVIRNHHLAPRAAAPVADQQEPGKRSRHLQHPPNGTGREGTPDGARRQRQGVRHPRATVNDRHPPTARRARHARVLQRFEQYTDFAERSNPTVHDAPHTGHPVTSPAFIAPTRADVANRHRLALARHASEQYRASGRAFTENGFPHAQQHCGSDSFSPTPTP